MYKMAQATGNGLETGISTEKSINRSRAPLIKKENREKNPTKKTKNCHTAQAAVLAAKMPRVVSDSNVTNGWGAI